MFLQKYSLQNSTYCDPTLKEWRYEYNGSDAALTYGVVIKGARYPVVVPIAKRDPIYLFVGPDNSTWDSYTVPLEGCLLGSSIADLLIRGSRWEANPVGVGNNIVSCLLWSITKEMLYDRTSWDNT